MNKKLLAVAIAAALAPAAAMADSGNVTIYGNLHMSVESLDGNSGAAGSTSNQRETNISSNSSYIGFKGTEDLGNGLKAIWQMESLVGMGNTSTGTDSNSFTSRNSFLGLNGGFGTALLGRHDTPMKIVGRKADLFSDQIGDSRNLISAGGATWDLRPDNVIAYISPNMNGLTGAVAYVTNTNAGAALSNSVTALSAMGTYETGPLMVGLGYEKHNLSNLGAGTNDEKGLRLVGGYSFGDVKVTALYQKLTDLGGGNTDRKTWGLGAGYKMGATT
ncbi:MAG: porin, partial [Sulfurimicrobium sp.]|nr:porin [Sulfurimicrobium sp.]